MTTKPSDIKLGLEGKEVKKRVINIFDERILSAFVRNDIWNRELLLIDWTIDELEKDILLRIADKLNQAEKKIDEEKLKPKSSLVETWAYRNGLSQAKKIIKEVFTR